LLLRRPHVVAARENRQLLNAALLACARAGDARAALRLYGEASERWPAAADEVSVNTLLLACREGGELSLGFALLVEALDARVGSRMRSSAVSGGNYNNSLNGAKCMVGVRTLMRGCREAGEADLAARVYGWATSADGPGGGGASAASRAVLLDQLLLTLLPRIASYDNDDGMPRNGGGPPRRAAAAVVNDSHLAAAADAFADGCAAGLPFTAHKHGLALVLALARAGDVDSACRTLWEAEQRHSLLLAPRLAVEGRLLRSLDNPDAAARLADEFASQRASPLWAGVERGRRKRLVDAARAVEAADDEQNRRRRRDNDDRRRNHHAVAGAAIAAEHTCFADRADRTAAAATTAAASAARGGGGGAADDARRRRPVSAAAAAAAAPSVLRSSHYSRQAAIAMRLALAELKALQPIQQTPLPTAPLPLLARGLAPRGGGGGGGNHWQRHASVLQRHATIQRVLQRAGPTAAHARCRSSGIVFDAK